MQTQPSTDIVSTDAFHSGFLWFEEVEGSEQFVRRFFVLDRLRDRLEYFSDEKLASTDDEFDHTLSTASLGHFSIHYISFITDSSSTRPKLQNGFYIIVLGVRYFFRADSEQEKSDWIRILSDASRISVPSDYDLSVPPLQNSCRVEIVGGVTHTTSLKQESFKPAAINNSGNLRSALSLHDNVGCIKAGFCVKQGAMRKNWKRRYFVLDTFALSYYTDVHEKSPIKVIRLKDIKQARVSVGIHPSKMNVFEIVTPLRVFYLQVKSYAERDSWIEAINHSVMASTSPKLTDAVTQTESESLAEHRSYSVPKFRYRITSV